MGARCGICQKRKDACTSALVADAQPAHYQQTGECFKVDGSDLEANLEESGKVAVYASLRVAFRVDGSGLEAHLVEAGKVTVDFRAKNEASKGDLAFTRVQFKKNGHTLKYDEVLTSLASENEDGKSMRSLYSQVLAGADKTILPFDEYFWECRPVSPDTLKDTTYEFVLIEASEMNAKSTDITAFDNQFVEGVRGTTNVIQFMTPSPPPKETNLICPARAPDTDLAVYRSIGSFFRGAPPEQANKALMLLGTQIPARMKTRGDSSLLLWVSTAGYDFAWLHMRLDNAPKYYRFPEYKQDYKE